MTEPDVFDSAIEPLQSFRVGVKTFTSYDAARKAVIDDALKEGIVDALKKGAFNNAGIRLSQMEAVIDNIVNNEVVRVAMRQAFVNDMRLQGAVNGDKPPPQVQSVQPADLPPPETNAKPKAVEQKEAKSNGSDDSPVTVHSPTLQDMDETGSQDEDLGEIPDDAKVKATPPGRASRGKKAS